MGHEARRSGSGRRSLAKQGWFSRLKRPLNMVRLASASEELKSSTHATHFGKMHAEG